MLRLLRKSDVLCVIIMLYTASSCQQCDAQAQQDAQSAVKISQEQARTFDNAMQALAEQTHTTFVIEGYPFKPVLVSNTSLGLKQGGELAPPLIARIAAAYDYDVQPKGNICLLRKRYSDPGDLPAITLGECRQSVQDVVTITSQFDSGLHPGAIAQDLALRDFMLSLTPRQTHAFTDSDLGLAVATLGPEGQLLVQRLINYFYVQYPLLHVQSGLREIQAASQGSAAFRWRYVVGLHIFGLELQTSAGDAPSFLALNKANAVTMLGGSMAINFQSFQNGVAVPALPADPTDAPKVRPKDRAPLQGTPLSTVVARLSERGDGEPKVRVDATLAAKPATIFGGEFASSKEVLSALADLYNLRIATERDGTRVLVHAAPPIVLEEGGLYDALRAVLPAEFLRYQKNNTSTNALTLRIAAARELRAAVEPLVKSAKLGNAPLSEVTDRERMMLADVLIVDTLSQLSHILNRDTPEYFARFNEIRLMGKYSSDNGTKTYSLFLALPASDGTLIRGPGFGGIDYPD